jgi:riboflavin synthase
MFTGIVEAVGSVVSMGGPDALAALTVRSEGLFEDLQLGASVSFNGVCLTAVALGGDEITVELVPETLSRTNLGRLQPGDRINLERAMPVAGRFDGHIVQGHVDGTVTVADIRDLGGSSELWFDLAPDLAAFIVEKGSVTLNGVSLTVAAMEDGAFSVALIPHTLLFTNLGSVETGDALNLEIDVLAKYVQRLLGKHQ